MATLLRTVDKENAYIAFGLVIAEGPFTCRVFCALKFNYFKCRCAASTLIIEDFS